MSELTLQDCMSELRMDLDRLTSIVEEVERHVRDGKLDSASLVLGSQTGKIGRFTTSWGGVQDRLDEAGADPKKALE